MWWTNTLGSGSCSCEQHASFAALALHSALVTRVLPKQSVTAAAAKDDRDFMLNIYL